MFVYRRSPLWTDCSTSVLGGPTVQRVGIVLYRACSAHGQALEHGGAGHIRVAAGTALGSVHAEGRG